ncbi:NAD-dependent epimerase/dehydratase family protein [Paenibacillus sp. RC67]|uniref:NAD-dependent epimerase/dehydratase family protein n=1 Tax=Paenibacillus sp. RC67 TaxID=3039392 RepID=UPI0024ADB9CF|nr:NAD-dependent epimerase/dehydratase family protein [Paenibacillus sp. RC67]
MKAIIFGATGMVGKGVLQECLLDPNVQSVLTVGRSATGQRHDKLHELIHKDLLQLTDIESSLTGFDACFFCLGVSSFGMTEEQYRAITYDITLNVARTLARLNPDMTFIYVTGMGTDSSESGSRMWARVKGKTENDLLQLPFKAAYMFRPGGILPPKNIRSKTKLYQIIYDLTRPFYPLLQKMFPQSITSSQQLGRAMIRAVSKGYPKPIIESSDINKM